MIMTIMINPGNRYIYTGKAILKYGCEVYGMQNYNVVEKSYLKLLKRTLSVKNVY